MNVVSTMLAWLAPPAPVRRLVLTRMFVGAFATVYLVVRIRYLAGGAARHAPEDLSPVGVCAILSSPLPNVVSWALALATALLGIVFTVGRSVRLVGPLFFIGLLWVISYASSWGKILHSENLLVIHVGLLALAGDTKDERVAGWALRAASIATVLTYLVAGITKLRSGGVAWLSGEALGNWLAWDAIRKIELGSLSSPFAAHLASSTALLQLLAVYTLLVELGAPVALLSRRSAEAWALLAWLFHVGILATMAIGFFYPLTAIAFAPLLTVERLPFLRNTRLGSPVA